MLKQNYGLVNDSPMCKFGRYYLIHANEYTNPEYKYVGFAWYTSGSSERCRITQEQAKRYNDLTSTLESAGFTFGQGQINTDVIKVTIHQQKYVLKTENGQEINYRGGGLLMQKNIVSVLILLVSMVSVFAEESAQKFDSERDEFIITPDAMVYNNVIGFINIPDKIVVNKYTIGMRIYWNAKV